jgi:hypothetical protein
MPQFAPQLIQDMKSALEDVMAIVPVLLDCSGKGVSRRVHSAGSCPRAYRL